jgi:hypothetical protein
MRIVCTSPPPPPRVGYEREPASFFLPRRSSFYRRTVSLKESMNSPPLLLLVLLLASLASLTHGCCYKSNVDIARQYSHPMVVPNTTTMAHRVSTEIESVTSNSKTYEEEQEEQSSQHSSDNDDNTLQRTANETVTSPDPAPIKGGDDEVLRFSRVASIVVKEAVIMEPEKNKRSTSPGPEAIMGRGVGRNRYSTGTTTIQRTDGNESEASNCKPMDVIMKSPYEPSLNAEKGIKVFTDMRSLLSESSHDNYRTVDPKAAKVFGPTNAWCLVKANGKSVG